MKFCCVPLCLCYFFSPIGTLFCFVEAGSHSLAYTDFKLSILLPPLKFWDCRCIASPLVLKVPKLRSHIGLAFMAKSISYLFQILEGPDIPWLMALPIASKHATPASSSFLFPLLPLCPVIPQAPRLTCLLSCRTCTHTDTRYLCKYKHMFAETRGQCWLSLLKHHL